MWLTGNANQVESGLVASGDLFSENLFINGLYGFWINSLLPHFIV